MLSHKIQIKNPTVKQERYFRQACGTARFAYNWGLSEWKQQYQAGQKPTAFSVKKAFNAIKPVEFPWVFQVTKCAPEQAFANLGSAFQRFFKRVGNYPQFKKKGRHDSFYLSNDQFKLVDKQIKIPKLGWVKLTEPLRFSGRVMSATVSRLSNRWFVSIQVQTEFTPNRDNQASQIGVDLGVKHLATLSNGEVVEGPKPLRNLSRRLTRLQRQLSQRVKGSNRYQKAKLKVSKLYYQMSCIRQDALHKLTHSLGKTFKVIGIEDLNVKGMMTNHKLAKAISDMGFYEFQRQLEYKSQLYGNWLQVVDRWFPSSKRCSRCGTLKELKLSDRVYRCECGLEMDRDLNAAINIEQEAVRLLA